MNDYTSDITVPNNEQTSEGDGKAVRYGVFIALFFAGFVGLIINLFGVFEHRVVWCAVSAITICTAFILFAYQAVHDAMSALSGNIRDAMTGICPGVAGVEDLDDTSTTFPPSVRELAAGAIAFWMLTLGLGTFILGLFFGWPDWLLIASYFIANVGFVAAVMLYDTT